MASMRAKMGSKTTRHSIAPGNKDRRSFASEKNSVGGKAVGPKKGGRGAHNWGDDAAAFDLNFVASDEESEEDPFVAGDQAIVPPSVVVRQKALAVSARRQASFSSEPDYPPVATAAAQPVGGGAWGQTERLEALRQKLLEKEAERIASMSPERLQLVAMLDEHHVRLDNHVIDALLQWKYSP